MKLSKIRLHLHLISVRGNPRGSLPALVLSAVAVPVLFFSFFKSWITMITFLEYHFEVNKNFGDFFF